MACGGVKYLLRPTSFLTSSFSRPIQHKPVEFEAVYAQACILGLQAYTVL